MVGINQGPLGLNRSGQLFFHPLQLHLEPTDLLIELGLKLVMIGGGLGWPGEQVLGVGQHLLFPRVDEGGMDSVLTSQLAVGFVPFEGCQGDLSFEGSGVGLAFLGHEIPLSLDSLQ